MCENGHTKMCFDKLEIHTIELKKFRKSAIIKPREKEFWLWFIDHTNKEMIDMACSKFNKIEKLQKKLDEMTADPAVAHELLNRQMAEYDRITALSKAHDKGMEEGRAEGEAKEKVKIARKMLASNISVEQICEITGLSVEEIKKLSSKS